MFDKIAKKWLYEIYWSISSLGLKQQGMPCTLLDAVEAEHELTARANFPSIILTLFVGECRYLLIYPYYKIN